MVESAGTPTLMPEDFRFFTRWNRNLERDLVVSLSLPDGDCPYFDVLLTVHYSNDQFWFQLGVCIVCPPEDGHVGARNM